jgi:hypothetical protein
MDYPLQNGIPANDTIPSELIVPPDESPKNIIPLNINILHIGTPIAESF